MDELQTAVPLDLESHEIDNDEHLLPDRAARLITAFLGR